MAIKIENEDRTYDRFQTTCSHCGRVLSYSRKDIKSHRRWPNGFIYCPACKAPIGHSEEYLVSKGEEVAEKEIAEEKAAKERRAVAATVRAYRVPMIILLAFGIPTLLLGVILSALCPLPGSEEGMIGMLIPGLIFTVMGLAMVIIAIVFAGKVKIKQRELKQKE